MRARKLNPRRWTLGRPGLGRAGRALSLSKGQGAVAALLTAVGVALLVWLVVIPATRVQAATYTVNVTTDGDDLSAGDDICDSDGAAGDQCSLRAAIEEANASVDQDVIAIGVTDPIVLLDSLPIITDGDLVITGSGQQVSLTVLGPAFTITADGVHMDNLVIDGENVGATGILISATTDDLVLDGLTVRGFRTDGFYNGGGGGGQRNTIRNSTFTANGGDGIDFDGGKDDVVTNNLITNNGDVAGENGLEIANEDYFLIQGNTFSDSFDAQIMVEDMAAGQHVSIIQNTIIAGSDGIVIGGAVDGTAHIDIGLAVSDRNVFRGAIAAPAEQYLKDLSTVNINAIYNDWNAYSPAAIEGVICDDVDPGCGPGVVNFDPYVTTPSPLETPTPTATATQSATGTPTVTPTATPGGVTTVSLIAGCNPEASTYPDGTPVTTIAGAVSPAGALISVWVFQAGNWLGYSELFPEASQTFNVERLGVVFLCLSSTGTFSRPVL